MFCAAGGWRLLLLIGIVQTPSSWNVNKTRSPPYRCAQFSGFLHFNLLLSAYCWREVCGGKRFVTAKFVVRRSRRKKVQWTALTNHQGHSFILSTERNVSNSRHFDDIPCQSFLMWNMDKHLVSTKYLR